MAYIFMCPGKYDERGWLVCHTFVANSGANLVLLQEEAITPILHLHPSGYPDYGVELIPINEPLIDTSNYDLDENIRRKVYEETKIGGAPLWIQYSEEPKCPKCGGKMRFVAQLSKELDGPLPADPKLWNTGMYKFFEFGDGGIGYVYLCENECSPDGASFLWQCT